MANRKKFGFVYCRSTPNTKEIKAMCNFFHECNILMGDFNLSHKSSEDQAKNSKLCDGQKINALKEITRSMSGNQLEYILIDANLKGNYFVTSYNNVISDHKTIVARIESEENKLTNEIIGRITVDHESHLKPKRDQFQPDRKQTENNSSTSTKDQYEKSEDNVGLN
jgi:hypothetical protein